MQKILWDRRICLKILDKLGVPTPKRLEVNRDGGPRLESPELARHVLEMSGVKLDGPEDGTGGGATKSYSVNLTDDGDTLSVNGETIRKPFVEKPTSGEDHNIRVYYPRDWPGGGGGRRLFRKVGNKSSEFDPELITPRSITEPDSSYLYEQFMKTEKAEDVKAYTVGPNFTHAESRKSPVVDGLVRRNTHGKELRFITKLTPSEQEMASKIATGFGQRICGFDLLRGEDKSYVIDVNGWSFVKDNNEYYDKCANILKQMFLRERRRLEGVPETVESHMDPVPQRRATGNHRAALKTIFRSPSIPKLHHHGHRSTGTSSPDAPTITTPLTSPPSLDRASHPVLPTIPPASELLPPPVIPSNTDQAPSASMPTSPANEEPVAGPAPAPASKHSWKLKGMVAVIRHADRTPKQKFKYTFHSQPFVELLKGHQEEVLLKGEAALGSVLEAVKKAMIEGIEDKDKLRQLRTALVRKGAWTGTKVQIKPMFRKRKAEESAGLPNVPENSKPQNTTAPLEKTKTQVEAGTSTDGDMPRVVRTPTRSDSISDATFSRYSAVEDNLVLDKLQLVIKWGGEPTHSARYQAQDVGENMRNDLKLMNKDALSDASIFTSSERRVVTSAQIWASAFLDRQDIAEDRIKVRKDLLDDSNAAKDVMDKVKKKLKTLLREGNSAPPQFAWPKDEMPEPSVVLARVVELMKIHREILRHNFKNESGGAAAALAAIEKPGESNGEKKKTVNDAQKRWCTGEDPELFKERWEKLFTEFCDKEKVDPSKISELYDSMKFDALHNLPFLAWVFTPRGALADEYGPSDSVRNSESESHKQSLASQKPNSHPSSEHSSDRAESKSGRRMAFRRKSTIMPIATPPPGADLQDSYFKFHSTTGPSESKIIIPGKLREMYRMAKVLFDFVGPQEYGIEPSEKLEIGLLTSLPLLEEIVLDLEEVQRSPKAKSFIYFTKESHIYTLLNCILEGGIQTKMPRNAIPELDYLSQICFELYEAKDSETGTSSYSIRIALSPGCHTIDPLDVQLDSKHALSSAQRRSLTPHTDWKEVIETLRAKFHTYDPLLKSFLTARMLTDPPSVKLPKSFLAVNVSDKHAQPPGTEEGEESSELAQVNFG